MYYRWVEVTENERFAYVESWHKVYNEDCEENTTESIGEREEMEGRLMDVFDEVEDETRVNTDGRDNGRVVLVRKGNPGRPTMSVNFDND